MQIDELESDLKMVKGDNEKLEKSLTERHSVLESYEQRFLSVRSIIEQKDIELKAASSKIQNLDTEILKYQAKLDAEKANSDEVRSEMKILMQGLTEQLAEKEIAHGQAFQDQLKDFQRKLEHKQAVFEQFKKATETQVGSQHDLKDKEIMQL